ncbi:hypothetical protein M231_03071 [Tremella mesenterica]|uniref:C2H2-type domain-containing protein n=1 Tax=Tremella mesenterica TaxID=5217 RepID=A0A4Q1BP98_TREME|nr:hypothetical protein M231_03071 [Tremella mesenterica]
MDTRPLYPSRGRRASCSTTDFDKTDVNLSSNAQLQQQGASFKLSSQPHSLSYPTSKPSTTQSSSSNTNGDTLDIIPSDQITNWYPFRPYRPPIGQPWPTLAPIYTTAHPSVFSNSPAHSPTHVGRHSPSITSSEPTPFHAPVSLPGENMSASSRESPLEHGYASAPVAESNFAFGASTHNAPWHGNGDDSNCSPCSSASPARDHMNLPSTFHFQPNIGSTIFPGQSFQNSSSNIPCPLPGGSSFFPRLSRQASSALRQAQNGRKGKDRDEILSSSTFRPYTVPPISTPNLLHPPNLPHPAFHHLGAGPTTSLPLLTPPPSRQPSLTDGATAPKLEGWIPPADRTVPCPRRTPRRRRDSDSSQQDHDEIQGVMSSSQTTLGWGAMGNLPVYRYQEGSFAGRVNRNVNAWDHIGPNFGLLDEQPPNHGIHPSVIHPPPLHSSHSFHHFPQTHSSSSSEGGVGPSRHSRSVGSSVKRKTIPKKELPLEDRRVYECPVNDCTVRCTRANDVQRHFRNKHTNSRPFSCPVCQCCWSRKDKLPGHMEKHHPNVPYTMPEDPSE